MSAICLRIVSTRAKASVQTLNKSGCEHIPAIVEDLHPANNTQGHEALRLHLYGHVELLYNGVHSEWHTTWTYVYQLAVLASRLASLRGDFVVTQDSHNAQMNIITAGRPSVFLVLQFVHICGNN